MCDFIGICSHCFGLLILIVIIEHRGFVVLFFLFGIDSW